MAIVMSFQTNDGVEHPESYWRIVFVRLDIDAMEAFVSFSGYHTAATRVGKKAIIGRKEYMVTGQEFLTYFGIPILSGSGNPLGNTYMLARATHDTPDGTFVPPEGQPDAPAPLVSFFKDGQDSL
jgi:hypothetical protein